MEEAPSRAKALLLLLPGGVAAGLGVWQLQRREWKAEQLAERTRQLATRPLPLSAATAAAAGEWRRVLCKGELRHDAAAYVRHPKRALAPLAALRFTRSSCAGGAACAQRRRHSPLRLLAGAPLSLLRRIASISLSHGTPPQIEPLVAADGRTVLLNRGWVPAEWRVRLRFASRLLALL